MGCCESTTHVMKINEFVIPNHLSKQTNAEFIDLSLSSESDIPAIDLENWRECKSSGSKSLIGSIGMSSTFLQSDRKISYYSKSGSIVDSFCCAHISKLD
ncbi:hypothetical protein SteCoe_2800 [Stentor coeruleus]|uniref:Uncharacterized protein n=1 Tax=Stentor coeruleus TaxID=5963 RepID=A0A1R2CYS4_9CILI|nr:hypothetical protein SteCoe_2800 [Stentor coeruleus]